jgi:hypothetical protein
MTKEQAMAIRSAQLRGEAVKAVDLQAAINVLGSKRKNKVRIPALRDEVRNRVNLTLMFNLGKALAGRAA